MKDYIKKQHSGNELGWSEEGKEVSTHRMTEAQAKELNSQFRNTGTKYEEVSEKAEKPKDETQVPEIKDDKPKRVRPSRAKVKA